MDKKQAAAAEKYIQPFIQLVFEQDQQQTVFELLDQIRSVFAETHLADFLAHIGIDEADKEKSLRLFQPSGSLLLDNLIELLITNRRAALFYPIVLESLRQIEKRSNEFTVTVRSVQTLSDAQKTRLIPLIEKRLGLKVRRLHEEGDSRLIGGFVITANNKRIDASIQHQLELVKEKLK